MKSITSWACDQTKSVNFSVENSVKKKTCNLNRWTADPAIRSCDTGQWIPCFDSCQLTTTWMCNIRLHAPTLPRKCDIFKLVALWCGRTDGRGGRTYAHTVTWLPKLFVWIDSQILLAAGLRYHHKPRITYSKSAHQALQIFNFAVSLANIEQDIYPHPFKKCKDWRTLVLTLVKAKPQRQTSEGQPDLY